MGRTWVARGRSARAAPAICALVLGCSAGAAKQGPVRAELICQETKTSGTGSNKKSKTKTLWRNMQIAPTSAIVVLRQIRPNTRPATSGAMMTGGTMSLASTVRGSRTVDGLEDTDDLDTAGRRLFRSPA